jgi:hypothetical protein
MAKNADEDMNQLERDIRQLKIEYEQYFGGGKKRPPSDLQWRIESTMKRYSDRGGEMNYGQRFRYGNLAQMYTKYRDIFRKRMQQKEEGTVQRHFGAAAREVEKMRALKRPAGKSTATTGHIPFTTSWTDPDTDKNKVDELYAAFRQAKESVGDSTEGFTAESFHKFVSQKTEQLKKQKNAHEVEYVVTLEGKHAKLKARVKS